MAINTLKTCSRCERILPLDAFNRLRRNADGFKTQCRDCTKEIQAIDRARHPMRAAGEKKLDRKAVNALAYSRLSIEHAATFLSRRKHSFERRTGMEAPPFMEAMIQMADAIISEHPSLSLNNKIAHRCARCDRPMEPGPPRRYCDVCFPLHQREMRQKRDASRPEPIKCQRCGIRKTRRRPAVCKTCSELAE